MNDLRQIRLLKSLAIENKTAVTLQLATTRKALTAGRAQLELLVQYHLDYKQRMHLEAGRGLASDTARNYQQFVQNVANAISQKQVEVKRLEGAVTLIESNWRDCERKVQSYATLEERALRVARIEEERFQQKQNDDFVSGRMRRIAAEN